MVGVRIGVDWKIVRFPRRDDRAGDVVVLGQSELGSGDDLDPDPLRRRPRPLEVAVEMLRPVIDPAELEVIDDNPVEVDVRRVRTETLAGGGAEFASGAEGLGSGSTGSSAIIFEEDSFGEGPSNSFSNIGAFYRKVLDMPGVL